VNAARILAGMLALTALTSAFAALEEFNVDPAHTYPTFAIRHLGISTQRGRFDKTTGKIFLDREGGKGSIDIAIQTGSVSTGSVAIDEVLRAEDFFDVARHPSMFFKSTSVEFDKGVPKSARGDLTMLGVSKPVTLAIEHFGCTRQPFLVRMTCGADLVAVISRSAYGMTAYSVFLSDEVRINIQIEAVRVEAASETPPAGG
jgi:polyisoprenoid-binding protein YceI